MDRFATVLLQTLKTGHFNGRHEQYVPKTKPPRDASSAPVVELWKSASSTSQNRAPEDRVDLAKSVLGEKIVSTITEEHKATKGSVGCVQ